MRSRTLLLVLGILVLAPMAEAQIAHLEKGGGHNPPTLPPKPLPPWIFGAASAGTTYFGGTVWAADSARWEAIVGGTWTFDSGVGSHFQDHPWLNPYKDLSLHASMEGWIGVDNTYSEITYFRRLTYSAGWADTCVGAEAGLGGTASFWAGALPGEADALCFAGGQGYGDAWNVCICKDYTYNGTGNVALNYDYAADTEPGFDYTYAIVDTSCSVDGADEVIVASTTGPAAGSASLTLVKGVDLRSNAGCIRILFCVRTDGANSDADGFYPTDCGALAVDDISVVGGGINDTDNFESGDDGWILCPAQEGAGGEWSNIVDIASLPNVNTVCPCLGGIPGASLSDSVLVFEDLTISGHNTFQDNVAVSPWIDLLAAGCVGAPFKQVYFEGYMELPLLNYIFIRVETQWYPQVCPTTGLLEHSGLVDDGFIRYTGGGPVCFPDTNPIRVDFSGIMDMGAEQVRIALGVVSTCRFFGNCTGQTNTTPWFDNARLCVFGVPGAPVITTRTIDLPQDAFPENGTLHRDGPGRLDANIVKGERSPEPNSSLGDTLVVQGSAANMEVYVVFAVDPGPGANLTALNDWLNDHASGVGPATLPKPSASGGGGGGTRAVTWYQARMDTAEVGGVTTTGSWMTTYHESDPNFSGNDQTLGTDLAPNGQARLENDIFRDDLFTPGTHVDLYYRARFIGSSSWFDLPAVNTTSAPIEWECLPSSMAADTSWNCVLYVDHADGMDAQPFIDDALGNILGYGSANTEMTDWDRYDVRAPSSHQGSLGRPLGTEYGARFAQIMGYSDIVYNSGELEAFSLVKEDADILIPYLSTLNAGEGFGNDLYISGNGAAAAMFQEAASDPSSLQLLNNFLGVNFLCAVTRDANCPVGSARDTISCIELVPDGVSGGANRTAGVGGLRSSTHLGQGNGCPQNRSFDVIEDFAGALGDPRMEEQYDGPANPPEDNAVVTNEVTGGPDYRSVLDGVSVHYRRDQTDCTFSTPPQTAVEERIEEVLTWFGIVGGASCKDPLAGLDAKPPIAVYHTALLDVAPNPYRGGAAQIRFTLSQATHARVEVFDIRGALVQKLLDGPAERGLNEVAWNGTNAQGHAVSNGVYFYRLRAEGKTFTKKVVVVQGGQ